MHMLKPMGMLLLLQTFWTLTLNFQGDRLLPSHCLTSHEAGRPLASDQFRVSSGHCALPRQLLPLLEGPRRSLAPRPLSWEATRSFKVASREATSRSSLR